MTAAIFGLAGVIVGGFIQSGAVWTMERRREDWAARKAGRLLARDFTRARFIMGVPKHVDGSISWGLLGSELSTALRRWPEHADVLAGTIVRHEDWNSIVQAIELLERIEQRASATPDEKVDADEAERLAVMAQTSVYEGGLTASLIGVAGIKTTRSRLRRLWRRLHPLSTAHQEAEAERLAAYSFEVDGIDPDDFEHDEELRAPGSA